MSILQSRAAMEATALIDQYRHESMALQRYLNVDADRKELADALREFYIRQGVTDVTQEMIDAAVEAFQRDRFTYRGFQGGALAKAVAKAYLVVNKNFGPIVIGLFLASASIGFTAYGKHQLEANRYTDLVKEITSQQEQYANAATKVKRFADDQKDWLKAVKKDKPIWAVDVTQTSLVQYEGLLSNIESKVYGLVSKVDGGTDPATLENVTAHYDQYKQAYQTTSAELKPLHASLQKDIDSLLLTRQSLEALWTADKSLSALMSTQNFHEFGEDPKVQYRLGFVESALIAGKADEATKQLGLLKTTLASRGTSKALQAGYALLSSQYGNTFKDAEGMRRAGLILAQARKAAEEGKEPDFMLAGTQLKALAQYVDMDLSIRPTDGPMSGVKRTPDKDPQGIGRSYIILQVVDAAGRVIPREVYNQEKQKVEVVTSWGQEISASEFQAFKADKLKNGFVSDPDFGRKPSGDYALTFKKPVLKGTITSWKDGK